MATVKRERPPAFKEILDIDINYESKEMSIAFRNPEIVGTDGEAKEIILLTKKGRKLMTKEDLKKCLSAWDEDKGIPVDGSDLYLSWENKNLNAAAENYGKTHDIRAVLGSSVNLEKLSDEQSACSGDGKNYHFLLTKKENNND